MKNVFQPEIANEVIERINKLEASTPQKWGKMDTAKMLAHCNVSYEMIYSNKHKRPPAIMRYMLKKFVKNKVVSPQLYKRNGRTAPQFIVKSDKDFNAEKSRLIDYINKTVELGENHFDNKESLSFGKLTKNQWNNMLYKHLDHHLNQFGA